MVSLEKIKTYNKQELLFCFFLFTLILPNIILSFTEPYSTLSSWINILLPLGVYGFLINLKCKPGISFLLLSPIIFINAFQLIILSLFGESIIAVDMFLNLFSTDMDEASELLGNLLLPILGTLAVYIPAVVIACFSARSEKTLPMRWRRFNRIASLSLIILSAVFIFLSKKKDNTYQIKKEVFPVNVFHNMKLAAKRVNELRNYKKTSENFVYNAKATHMLSAKEVYVLVIGETSRACQWQLYGYERETTPLLSAIKDELIVFKDNMTQANTTYKSVPTILSPASAQEFSGLHKMKSICTAFKEAGFYTAFISTQAKSHGYIEYFSQEADESYFLRLEYPGRRIMDHEMLPYLDRLLHSEKQKILVILHSYGSHFNYQDRYEKEEALFKPDKVESTSRKYLTQLRNAYDNAIRSTDRFLHDVIDHIRQVNGVSAMIYVSDHGEDIYDDDRNRFLHSSPTASYYQIHVPLLLWLSNEYKKAFEDIAEIAVRNETKPTSSHDVFHTLLDLAGVETSYKKTSRSLIRTDYEAGVRYYLNDYNEAVPIPELDLKKEDRQMFAKKGLAWQ